MNLIVAINALAMALFAASLALAVQRMMARRLHVDTGVFLCLIIAIYLFVNASNVLEHGGITDALDFYEDFVEMLAPLFFLVFLNSIRLHRDIYEREKNQRRLRSMLDEREELLKEIHHRVKNNLQLVISIINLQMTSGEVDSQAGEMLMETQNRVFSMAAVYDVTYGTGDYGSIPAGDFIGNIVQHAARSGAGADLAVNLDIDESLTFRLERAVPLGLLVNERVSAVYRRAMAAGAPSSMGLSLAGDAGRRRAAHQRRLPGRGRGRKA
jgi:hypothetical protein